ncbi:MAG TPA: hypothetical protein VK563_00405 [Puia sp.]|nr:hypothetical protein [Puia sp.]
MKFLKFVLPLCLAFCFTGCLDIDETVDLKNDGSGSLTMNTDLSQMVELLQNYVGKEELAKKGMQKMDTTILMKDVVDTISTLSADKKALLRRGSVAIKLNMDEKVFRIKMQFPFNSQDELQKLYGAMSDGSLGATQLFKGMNPGGSDGGQINGPSPDINQFNGIYDFVSRDGMMSKKLNMDKWKALQDNPQLAQMKEAGKMGIEILYTTILKLPRPVKKIDNPLAKLSEDKKTVTIKYNLVDVFDHPEQFGYSIEY